MLLEMWLKVGKKFELFKAYCWPESASGGGRHGRKKCPFGAWRGASWRGYGQGSLRCSNRIGLDGSSWGNNNGFRLVLSRYPEGCILDEVQRAPELLSYLQGILDAVPRPGRFILTGSQQFGLMERVSQSLAGRTALLTLLPLTLDERESGGYASASIEEQLFTGGYPAIFDQKADPETWLNAYLATYVERDVRQVPL